MTDADQVIDSYKRDRDRKTERTIEDALREERNEARAKLIEIALKLGCPVDEILPRLSLMEKQIEDARAIVRKAAQ
jgi:hypothetical protein